MTSADDSAIYSDDWGTYSSASATDEEVFVTLTDDFAIYSNEYMAEASDPETKTIKNTRPAKNI